MSRRTIGTATRWAVTAASALACCTIGRSPLLAAGPPNTASQVKSVRLLAVGDLMLGTSVKHRIVAEGADYPFRHAAEVLRAPDITFGNLETPLSSRGRPTPGKSAESLRRGTNYLFRAPPSCATALADSGFDVVSLANNHAMDYQWEALQDSIRELRAAKVVPFGAGRNLEEAYAPVVVTRHGVRVAFIGVTDILPALSSAAKSSPGVAPAPRGSQGNLLQASIAKARKEADFVAVCVHWGIERKTTPSLRQRSLARVFIDQGADLVIGSHPHVLQPVGRYRNGVIHYSLGNFITYISKSQSTEAIEFQLRKGQRIGFRRIPFAIRNGQAIPNP